jgi:hypothetical protein
VEPRVAALVWQGRPCRPPCAAFVLAPLHLLRGVWPAADAGVFPSEAQSTA